MNLIHPLTNKGMNEPIIKYPIYLGLSTSNNSASQESFFGRPIGILVTFGFPLISSISKPLLIYHFRMILIAPFKSAFIYFFVLDANNPLFFLSPEYLS